MKDSFCWLDDIDLLSPLQYFLKRGEPYGRMRTLYAVTVLGGYLKVPDERTPGTCTNFFVWA